ncbi:ABC transporter substrate-binding protein [Anaeromicropila populeti]|uniref:Putative aldouronate transport system substrate-binding protein n=1 Tax=Anaeromicropila populeti TaxID=37658 RepID=A0A1I6LF62_9FIRM|nr:ABC transporter substrate-binding protein [Anaeromicropila populeti]SFS02094.1 putative aldouronate transport system substrate-binding protein [Anaeromicropila populeti]
MRKGIKKVAVVFVAAIVTVIFFTCDNLDSKEEYSQDGAKKYDKIVFAYATFNALPEEEALQTVEEAVNKITREKIGAEVKLMPIAIADYSSYVNMELQSGSQIDIYQTFGSFNEYVSNNMTYDLTNIMESCAPKTKQLLGEEILSSCKKDEKIFGIPAYKPYGLVPMLIYKREIAEKLNIDMTKIKSVYDLTSVLRKVKKEYPDMEPLVPVMQGTAGANLCIQDVDYLTDDYNSPKGIIMGQDMTVIDYYGTDEFKNTCNLVRTWYKEGLIVKDAATTTSTSRELMSLDKSFCYIACYSSSVYNGLEALEKQCGGEPLGAVQLGEAYLNTVSVNSVTWAVSSTSRIPETALKFLDLTFTDEDIINLLIYGIEGRDYVISQDGYAMYPEGKDAFNVPYTAQLSCGIMGNYFLVYPLTASGKEYLKWEEEQNKTLKKSPALGFTFDSSSVKIEYTAVENVIQQYLPALLCGSVDPQTIIPEFKENLSTAGLDNIIEAKQEQLNEWVAKNNGQVK